MSVTTVAGSFITLNTINSDHYVDGSIDLVHIGANQIDGTKIALGSELEPIRCGLLLAVLLILLVVPMFT